MVGRRWSNLDAGEDYADWAGTVWADEHVAIRHPTLSEAVGLNPHRWRIVAIDLRAAPRSAGEIVLTAQDRDATTAEEDVVEFLITGISVATFIDQVFVEFHAALTVRGARGAFRVVDRRTRAFPRPR